nr:hypothetical protein [Lachnospiraceae bacterium]
VEDSGMAESYHENYKIYEEQLNDDCSIFTNLANGSVTNRPVIIDVPDGVDITLKKDGNEVSFKSRQPITDQGSYVLTTYVIAADQEELPFSEQTVSRGKYRFRIQYEIGIAGYEASDNGGFYSDEEESTEEATEESSEEPVFDELPTEPITFEEEVSENIIIDGSTEEAEEESTEEAEETEVNKSDLNISFLSTNGMSGIYDEMSGFYKNTLLSGAEFFTNISNGMFTNEPVMIQEAENLDYIVYKDGETYEGFKPGQYIQDPGSYVVYVKESGEVSENQAAKRLPKFFFRIINGEVNNLGFVNNPELMKFTSVVHDGVDESEKLINENGLRIIDDGSYEATLSSDYGTTTVYFTMDTMQPFFNVTIKPNIAEVSYMTDDVSYCTLYKNDEIVESGTVISEVNGSGNYKLDVYDRAGNLSTSTFKVNYRINAGAVVAIILILGIVGVLIFYLIRIRKKVKVR